MATLDDPAVRDLLDKPNYAVVSTHNKDGSIHSTVAWVAAEDGKLTLNSHTKRVWPANLQRDPRVNVLVQETGNPYKYVEIRGTAEATTDGADEHIDLLSQKYTGHNFEGHQPGLQRIKFVVSPERVRVYT